MCYHSKLTHDAQSLENRFKAKVQFEANFQSNHFNGFAYPKTPVITGKTPNEIVLYQWGLIPSWAKDKSIQNYTLNAKIETLAEKPSFKGSINKRCLIIVDGFIEWQWLDPKGKKKQPYLISLPNDDLFAFAGIWSEWLDKDSGEVVNTYSIVTTEANPLMAEIHNSKKRMPVILTPENENEWLGGTNYLDFTNCDLELQAKEI